jgi:hypothetical protein
VGISLALGLAIKFQKMAISAPCDRPMTLQQICCELNKISVEMDWDSVTGPILLLKKQNISINHRSRTKTLSSQVTLKSPLASQLSFGPPVMTGSCNLAIVINSSSHLLDTVMEISVVMFIMFILGLSAWFTWCYSCL